MMNQEYASNNTSNPNQQQLMALQRFKHLLSQARNPESGMITELTELAKQCHA